MEREAKQKDRIGSTELTKPSSEKILKHGKVYQEEEIRKINPRGFTRK